MVNPVIDIDNEHRLTQQRENCKDIAHIVGSGFGHNYRSQMLLDDDVGKLNV